MSRWFELSGLAVHGVIVIIKGPQRCIVGQCWANPFMAIHKGYSKSVEGACMKWKKLIWWAISIDKSSKNRSRTPRNIGERFPRISSGPNHGPGSWTMPILRSRNGRKMSRFGIDGRIEMQWVFRFPGGRLSLCYNALDRHVDEGRGNRDALIWDSPITGNKDTYSFSKLQKEVRLFNKRICKVDLKVEQW